MPNRHMNLFINRRTLFIALLLMPCLSLFAQVRGEQVWDFNDLTGWEYEHQDDNPRKQIKIKDGVLRIHTRARSLDRKKVRTPDKIYTTGRYTWRTYISKMGKRDQSSIGMFLCSDDHHELDFEVGYGRDKVRKALGATRSEMIAYMTSQDLPFQSVPVKIQRGWHLFAIDLKLSDSGYVCSWFIDDTLVCFLPLNYGSDYKFHIYCSVENLPFIGDRPARKNNYGLFDFVEYKSREDKGSL